MAPTYDEDDIPLPDLADDQYRSEAAQSAPVFMHTRKHKERAPSMDNDIGNGGENGLYEYYDMPRCQSMPAIVPPARSRPLSLHPEIFQAFPPTRTEAVEVVAEQSWLITKLTIQLLWALRMSKRWIMCAIRLATYSFLLLPAIIRVGYFWACDKRVHRNIIYGTKRRNLLDVYTSKEPGNHRPVIIFIPGGAWIIGYKAWGAYFGKILSEFGIVVVTPDYRNFPQGVVSDMVEDASTSIQWVFDHIHLFGGDPKNITLIGQSAGAHLAACSLLDRLEDHATINSLRSTTSFRSCDSMSSVHDEPLSDHCDLLLNEYAPVTQAPTWRLHQLRSFIGISGPYNLEAAIATFHRHGFDKRVVERIMDHRLRYFSPTLRVEDSLSNVAERFPRTYLFHGTADVTVNYRSTEQFQQALALRGAQVSTRILQEKTHTDVLMEDPILGDHYLLQEIVEIVKERAPRDTKGQIKCPLPDTFEPSMPYYPKVLVKAARWVNPF